MWKITYFFIYMLPVKKAYKMLRFCFIHSSRFERILHSWRCHENLHAQPKVAQPVTAKKYCRKKWKIQATQFCGFSLFFTLFLDKAGNHEKRHPDPTITHNNWGISGLNLHEFISSSSQTDFFHLLIDKICQRTLLTFQGFLMR